MTPQIVIPVEPQFVEGEVTNKVGPRHKSPLWIVGIVLGIAIVLAVIQFSTIENQQVEGSEWAEQSAGMEPELLPPYQTKAACEYLIPVLEEYAPSFGNNVSDGVSDSALAAVLLAVRRADREYDVRDRGLYEQPGRGVPLYLEAFGLEIESTITMTFSSLDNSLVWANFVDSLYANVVEPCSSVGVTFSPSLN